MRFSSLEEWLTWQETLHPEQIDLGLERVAVVRDRLCPEPVPFTVITVAGTNGKGSTVTLMESMLRAAGYRVGAYTSPHLLRYNERIRIDGTMATDAALCDAFARVDAARGSTSLTYFEFGTLAAIDLFYRARVEVALLEVGMGGRLDAVNLLDADVAVVTTVDIDHTAWLGEDRETIGREKAGIFRADHPAVCGETEPPKTVVAEAERLRAPLYRQGREFVAERSAPDHWTWRGPGRVRRALPLPTLHGSRQIENAATALMALELLAERFPVEISAVRRGLLEARLAGRFQLLPGPVPLIFDVAHNAQAARELAANLAAWPCTGKTLAVFAMLVDKASGPVATLMAGEVDRWYLSPLCTARSATMEQLVAAVAQVGGAVERCGTVAEALAAARAAAVPGDRVVVFGSFYTVAEALREAV